MEWIVLIAQLMPYIIEFIRLILNRDPAGMSANQREAIGKSERFYKWFKEGTSKRSSRRRQRLLAKLERLRGE